MDVSVYFQREFVAVSLNTYFVADFTLRKKTKR